MKNTNKNTCVVMVKNPWLGSVKTRLAKEVGEKATSRIYLNLLKWLNERVMAGDTYKSIVAYTPAKAGLPGIFTNAKDFVEQATVADIGVRMNRLIEEQFKSGCRKVVLVGSDIPELSSSVIDEAFGLLDVNDAVIGPSVDGGYYLIGFKKESFHAALFYGPKWSSDTVLAETLNKAGQIGLNTGFTTILSDLDNRSDLCRIIENTQTVELKKLLYLSDEE